MDEDRRDSRRPGRRYEDAAVRELVRTLLEDEGYVTQDRGDLRYVQKTDVVDRRVDRRAGTALWLALIGLFASPFLGALASRWLT